MGIRSRRFSDEYQFLDIPAFVDAMTTNATLADSNNDPDNTIITCAVDCPSLGFGDQDVQKEDGIQPITTSFLTAIAHQTSKFSTYAKAKGSDGTNKVSEVRFHLYFDGRGITTKWINKMM